MLLLRISFAVIAADVVVQLLTPGVRDVVLVLR